MLRKTLTLAAAALALAVAVQAQTVDDLISKNLAARGGKDKIKALKSAKITGKMTMGPGMDAPFTWEWKRPNSFRIEFVVQGMTGVQAYDGTTGWQVMPFMGKKDAEKMPAEELKDVDDQADFEGPLVDYKDKGHTIEFVGKEPIEGTDAYKLKLTKKSGDVSFIYLDAESFLEIKEVGKRTVRGEEHEFESTQGDYKEVGGVLFPFSMEQKPKGAPQGQVITIEKIDLNNDEPADRFKMPEVKAAEPAKTGQ
jgi:outer membrane lipoprotein-sorting protein